MATTTTNYGFDIPTSSDLVKDGATAIATLGQDIDTFLNRPITYNGVINAAMQIAQRGTSFSVGASGVNVLDRWKAVCFNGAGTLSQQLTNDITNLPSIQYCLRVQRNSGTTSTQPTYVAQSFENLNSTQYAGKTVTFSFYARKGSGFTGTIAAVSIYGTGTNQNFIDVGITGQGAITTATPTLTTTWQRFTYTGYCNPAATQVFVYFQHSPTGTAPANDYFEVTGVQLEVGNQASPFQTASGGSVQSELAMCQRYYYNVNNGNSVNFARGQATGTGSSQCYVVFPVPMRISPTFTFVGSASNLIMINSTGGSAGNPGSVSSGYNASNLSRIDTASGSGLTAGNFTAIQYSSGSPDFQFSAEL